MLLLAAIAALSAPAVPLASCPLLPAPPQIDGRLGAGEWAKAAAVGPFTALGDPGSLAPSQPKVLVGHTAQGLYIAAFLPCPGKPKADVREHDGNLWDDDAVEIFIQPPQSRQYYQFIANAAGARYEGVGVMGKQWDAAWRAAAGSGQGGWILEVEIPFAAFGRGRPADGEVWRFNVGWDRQTPARLLATWAPIASKSYHTPEAFGRLVFVRGGAVLRRLDVSWQPLEGAAQIKAEAGGGSGRLVVGEAEKPTGPAGASISAAAKAELGRPKSVKVEVYAGSRPSFSAAVPVAKLPALEIAMRTYFLREDKIYIQADGRRLGQRALRGAKLRAELREPGGRVLSKAEADFRGTRAWAWLGVRGVRPGRYEVAIRAVGKSGREFFSEVRQVKIPPKPAWLGNKLGISDRIYPPFKPLRYSGRAILPWGRRYEFGVLPFPSRVVSRGEDLLAGPIRLIAVVNGRQQKWQGGGPIFTRRTASRCEFTVRAEGQDVSVRARLWCEYDGCLRCDWEIVPKRRKLRLELLRFEMPYRPEHARLLYHYPGRWRSAFNAGSLPPDGLVTHFRPYVWLGDEWRGLAWFCPSDRGFEPADRGRVTEIVPGREQTVLRINMIERPRPLEEPLSFTFGFEATPIRPNPETVWDYRIIHSGRYGLEKATWSPAAYIEYPARGAIRVEEGTLEAWVRPNFDPNVPVKPDDPGRGRYNRNFFLLRAGRHTVGFYWNIDDRGMRVYVRTPDGRYPVVRGARMQWKKGEWHHVAFSWGREIRIYCDGKLALRVPFKGLGVPADALAGGSIQVGSPGACEFDVDELCISDIQREPRGHKGPLAADEHTLLLERFERLVRGPRGMKMVPEVGPEGRVFGPLKLVDGRFGRAAALRYVGKPVPILRRYRELGVRTICFHEHWSRIQNYFAPWRPDQLRSLVRACHENGLRLLVYYGYELSNIAPEWELYRDEVLIYPRGGGYHRQPEQRCYICCYNSAWQDYLAWAIARTIDEFDVDGVYLDGTANPFGCANVGHGCGWVDEAGQWHRNYPFFAARQMMKRIFNIVKSRKPRGLVNVHQSTCMTIPSVGFATSYWDGEQFGSIPREQAGFALKVLPLDAFRAEFMGHNWGVPAELLCYDRPYTFTEALAFTLPHDVLVRPLRPQYIEMASRIWLAAERFGKKRARFLPYWENSEYVQTDGPGTLCTIWSRGRAGAMVVVSNVADRARRVEARLNLRALGLPERLAAEDVMEGKRLSVRGGRLSFWLEPLQFRLLILRPAR